jgi:hypothetical protein
LTCKYTAPPVDVPSPNPAVIKVASSADPGKNKTANLTVTDPIAVTLTPSSASIALGATQTFTATITGATSNAALLWYVNGVQNGNSAQGTLTACTTSAPLTCKYTAPPVDVPSPNPAVIKVASSADPGKNKTANLTVTDPIAVTLTPSSASIALSGTQTFTATITGATSNAALLWYVNGVQNGSSTQGTLTACTTSAPLTCKYTAPSVNVPTPNPAVIKVASSADPGKNKTANLTVTDSIAVGLSPSSASLAPSGTQVFTATITGTTNTALNWYVNGVKNGNSTQGTLTACTSSSPWTCKYTAPASVPSPNPAVVEVTSAADPSKNKSANVTVTSSETISITHPTGATSVAVGSTLPITVSVTGGTASVTWTVEGVTNGNSTYGTITGAYPSYTYTPPSVIPGASNPVTLEATQSGASEPASLSVTIEPSTSAATPIAVSGAGATGVNLSLPTFSTTLGLADVGDCVPEGEGLSCNASVTGFEISRSGAATASCPSAPCTVWLLGQAITTGSGPSTALASGLTVSVSHGGASDVTVSSVTPFSPNGGYDQIIFTISVTGTAPIGIRDLIVTIGSGGSMQTQVYVGAIQIVD